MTGFYVRVYRDGHWVNSEIENLTDIEWNVYVATQDIDAGWSWARALALWIHNNVRDETGPA